MEIGSLILGLFTRRMEFPRMRFAQTFSLTPKIQTRTEKTVLWGLLALSGAAILGVVIFYFMNPRSIVGDQLVNTLQGTPAEFPPPGTFPIYVKPITLLFAAGIVFSYSFFVLAQEFISKQIPKSLRYLCLVVSITLLAMGLYEVLFNFALWGALMVSGASPNTLVNTHPFATTKINLDYATKMTVLWSIVAFFSTITFKNSLEIKEKTPEIILAS